MSTPNPMSDLYQEIILDHNRRPRNQGSLEAANRRADGDNPLCGDRLHVELRIEDDRIADIACESRGCAISTASASLMSEAVKGRSIAEARDLFNRFRALVGVGDDRGAAAEQGLGKLQALGGVREFPMRIKCATLAWHTLQAALEDHDEIVSTES